MAARPIVHVITGLDTGGAELMLYKLLSRMDRERFVPSVVSLTTEGEVGRRLRAIGVPVHALGMSRRLPDPAALLALVRRLRRERPALVQTWMYHADLVGGLAARLAGRIPVLWGIRQSDLDRGGSRPTTRWVARLCARLSRRLPAAIIVCSETGRRVHEALGYDAGRMVFIPNGFDLEDFAPRPAARAALRGELGLGERTPLIGLPARLHPQKDHATFVQAAAALHRRRPEAHFVLCGQGLTWDNPELAGRLRDAGIAQCCHLLGLRADMADVMAALDIATSSSAWGEGFSNAVGEAMSCGVPCVVTDVGDSARIVGDTGLVVPPRDPQALAAAWRQLLELPAAERFARGRAARRRIEERYGLEAVAAEYERVYRETLKQCAE